MKKFLLFFLLCVSINAQTTLSAGDIAIVMLNNNVNPMTWAWVPLVDISSSTTIYFTDDGWDDITGAFGYDEATLASNNDDLLTFVTTSSIPKGTVISVSGSTFSPNYGTVSVLGAVFPNSSSGDQIFAFQGTFASPVFIAGLHANYNSSNTNATTHWDNTNNASLSTINLAGSTLPTGDNGLVDGTSAVSLYYGGTEVDFAYYSGSTMQGTKAELLAVINNRSNWTSNNSTAYTWSRGNFTVDIPSVTFGNGSGFAQSITPNSTSQALGRFQLTGASSGATLTAASIKLNNERSGLSNFKLWSSTDATFGGDTQVGSTVAADPGNGNSVSFSGSSSISTSGTYFFLTADVAAGASGTVQGVIVQNSSLTVSSGTLTGTIANDVLSSNTAPLPVELTSFTASSTNNNVQLNWQTATEVNNYGFEIERKNTPLPPMADIPSREGKARSDRGVWETLGFIEGNGNSNSPKEYSFVDKDITGGSYLYRLKQIDIDGSYTYSKEIAVEARRGESLPTEFALFQNYPNPFNPSTTICFVIPNEERNLNAQDSSPFGIRNDNAHVTLKVYDVLGNEVATLVNEAREPGNYEVEFNASNLPSGIYFYRIAIHSDKLSAGGFVQTNKMILIK